MKILESLHKMKFEYSSLAAREPLLAPFYQPIVWWQKYKVWRYGSETGTQPRECTVGPHTDIIIDGFQGSANSFAADAFKRSQRELVVMAHHMHSPAQIIRGIKMSIPTLVTVREPKDAALSLTSRWPYVSMGQALRGYVGFYGKLEPHLDKVVLSPFEITINQLDTAVVAVNKKFGTTFDMTSQAMKTMRVEHGPAHKKAEAARRRKRIKAQKAKELEDDTCRRYLQRAERLYDRVARYAISGNG